MSFTDTRDEIAAALDLVPGVNGYAIRPKSFRVGDAWPQLESVERGPGDAFQATWRVFLVLGGDEFAAITKLDELLPEVCDVLDPVAYVDGARPVVLPSDAGEVQAALITVRSE